MSSVCNVCKKHKMCAAQCSHWSICPHCGWYVAVMPIIIQTMDIKSHALLETTSDAMCD